MNDDDVSEAFAKIARLGCILKAEPLNKWPGGLEIAIDERWWIAVNGHNETTKCSKGADVLPFHAWIEYNGWPAGMVSPTGGIIATGSCANENTFIEALDKRIQRRRS